ncbi:MAG: hypothetical protein O4861_04160 [Trichodesmium sp. St16_bin4-tuft]|nr:hypothetical protein [Trichodesmium sp. MAG_R01]MDE5068906.1 hypothetical protein [Trichodesmium sp. St4_bin8_1]MDE5073357.1 hypothetical protein [Trichodesmium sp. St5_bin8]MDE5077076.1 hypothetical protein [Trichodesmium sp. St2_bin6]MDE5097570.1 hypothetical protein [Trichodesmium sp. St16_bin4-tuft]MDE5102392.1 hypothetical protein [Trichodesmium sp. St19_bin2]
MHNMQAYFSIDNILEKKLSYNQYFVSWLEDKIFTPSPTIPIDETLPFLLEALELTSNSQGDPQTVYPLIAENLDLLEPHFIYILRKWARQTFPNISQNRATIIANTLVNFAGIIWALPEGDSDVNLEIALACCELALEVYYLDKFPEQWAIVHNNLTIIYQSRCYGVPAHNLIKSLEHYQKANLVFFRQRFPKKWTDLS